MISQINLRNYYEDLFPKKGNLLCLDLGANLGLVSIFATPCSHRVLAVEPEPTTFEMLSRLTKPFPQIECVQAAIAPKTGRVSLSVDSNDFSCHTITNPRPEHPRVEVDAFTFPDFCKLRGLTDIDVCKVDIEGAEMECFTDAVLASAPVKAWYMEVHRTPASTRERNHAIMLERLKRRYVCHCPRPNAIIAKQR